MRHTGQANLPLHPGRAPKWLFGRMVTLSEAIVDVMVDEFGPDTVIERISDPFWFQALSCVLGFDWHSSGTTTVTCGALKEAINPERTGIGVAGGKGKASLKAPKEIVHLGERLGHSTAKIDEMVYSSKLSAKVDNAAVQDGHQLYHHVFFMTEKGKWTVVQQGLNDESGYARRYHWADISKGDFVDSPHSSILGKNAQPTMDLSSNESAGNHAVSVDIVNDGAAHLERLFYGVVRADGQSTIDCFANGKNSAKGPVLDMPRNINWNTVRGAYEVQPRNYEELISIKGIGPSTVRALALIGELVYGEKPSWKDPVKYTFTVGGKDGVPYPVDRKVMDETAALIKAGVEEAKLGDREKLRALKTLRRFVPESDSYVSEILSNSGRHIFN